MNFGARGHDRVDVKWHFCLDDSGALPWMWAEGTAPEIDRLLPVRKPRSSKRNRHIPVRAFSVTNSRHLELESGLEHDLVRKLDRDPDVMWLVAQPFRLSWRNACASLRGHTPDLLALHSDGGVTVWDARATPKQDDGFLVKAEITKHSCWQIGWRYEIFPGLGEVERLNLLWLHGFRRQPPWLAQCRDSIQKAASLDEADLRSLLAADDGSGELITCVWHLVWTGELAVDLLSPIVEESRVTLGSCGHG
jgi:hypothetical protein